MFYNLANWTQTGLRSFRCQQIECAAKASPLLFAYMQKADFLIRDSNDEQRLRGFDKVEISKFNEMNIVKPVKGLKDLKSYGLSTNIEETEMPQ